MMEITGETPCVSYGDGEFSGATFARVCPVCGRFVKADKTVKFDRDGQPLGRQATCRIHGRVALPWLGYIGEE